MELMKAIQTRRSIRAYRPEPVDRETIRLLISAAVLAPTAMNTQPWAFGVVTDREKLRQLSESAKRILRSRMAQVPQLERFRADFENPDFSIFYHAPALVVVYARDAGHYSAIDCSLAAQNLMLAACDLGLGSCWIDFGRDALDQPEMRAELKVPDGYQVVAPIIIGHPAGSPPMPERKPLELLYWS